MRQRQERESERKKRQRKAAKKKNKRKKPYLQIILPPPHFSCGRAFARCRRAICKTKNRKENDLDESGESLDSSQGISSPSEFSQPSPSTLCLVLFHFLSLLSFFFFFSWHIIIDCCSRLLTQKCLVLAFSMRTAEGGGQKRAVSGLPPPAPGCKNKKRLKMGKI